MLQPSEINAMELLLIGQIERDETWLFGEKMGHAVDSDCLEVVTKVLEVIIRCVAQWRADFESATEEKFSPIALSHHHFVSSCRLAT
jgi:hypothetical protein